MKNMKIILILAAAVLVLLLVCLFFFFQGYTQPNSIVSVKGEVFLRQGPSGEWQRAEQNTRLAPNAELKVGAASSCDISLDDKMKDVVTVKDDSQVKIESLKPSRIFLQQGRVYSVIDNLKKIEDFQVRTPTAVVGVRGTGLEVSFLNGSTLASCFEHKIYVRSLDSRGNILGRREVPFGQCVAIDARGEFGNIYSLSPGDWEAWNMHKGRLAGMRTSIPKRVWMYSGRRDSTGWRQKMQAVSGYARSYVPNTYTGRTDDRSGSQQYNPTHDYGASTYYNATGGYGASTYYTPTPTRRRGNYY